MNIRIVSLAALVVWTILPVAAEAASVVTYSHGSMLASFNEAGTLRPGLFANGDLVGLPPGEPTRAIIEFSLDALPDNIVIDAADFSYYPGAVTTPQQDALVFYGYSGNGVPEASDYDAGALIHQNPGVVNFGVYNTFDVTAFIQSLVDADATHAGITVRNNTTASTYVNIYTAYLPDFNYYTAPRLSVQYSVAAIVPSPVAASAAGLMLMGLLLAQRGSRSLHTEG